MPVVKLFRSNPERIDKENPTALSLLQVEMDTFMLGLDVEVRQVNGPFVSYLPPEREGSPERVIYTANVVYNQKPRT
jgi:hypothetical protein